MTSNALRPDGNCRRGEFTSFILFNEVEASGNDDAFKYVHSFISFDDGESWEEAYLRVTVGTKIADCKNYSLADEDLGNRL